MSCRYLVTGGAGFIGSHLVEALIGAGDSVLVLDDASTGSMANLAGLCGHPQLRLRAGSVCDHLLVEELVREVDRVVHLAAAVGVAHILDRQVAGIMTNLRGTEVVLRAASAAGSLPVFLASSSEVYGKSAAVPYREDGDSVLGPTSLHRWSYACGKAMDEFLALAYHRELGLPVIIGRFFNITGPRQSPRYGMVLPRFCRAALADDELLVHGDGRQTRCFLHVADAVAAVQALLACPAAEGQVVNIGSAEEVSIRELAERVIAAAGGGRLRLQSYAEAFPQGGFEDLQRRVPEVTRLCQLTAWRQRYDLQQIIDDCLQGLPAELKKK